MTTPNRLFDELQEKLNVRTDKELAKILGYSRSTIKGFRIGAAPISAKLEIKIMEATNWGLFEMRGKGRG